MKEKQRKKKTRASGKLPQRLSSAGFAGVVLLVLAICGCRAGMFGGAEEASAFALPEMPEHLINAQSAVTRSGKGNRAISAPLAGKNATFIFGKAGMTENLQIKI